MDFLNYLSWLIISVNPTIELPELTQDWEIDSWREQTEPCAPGPRRKEQWPHKRLSQACLWVSGSLQWRRGLVVACWWAGGTECSSTYMGSFEGGHHYLHYLHLGWPQVNSREGTQLHPTENWIKDLLSISMALAIRSRPSFPPQSVYPIRKLP